jgi:ribose transport system substrate-binding protein
MTIRFSAKQCMSSIILTIALAGALAACGSSSTKGSSSSTGSASSSSTGSASSSSTGSASAAASASLQTPLGTVPVDKVYFPGVPSLAQLYKAGETAPPTSSPPIAKKKFVIFVSCGQAVSGCSTPASNVGKVAKLVGWKYAVTDGALDVNNGYTTAMDQAIAEKPDAIVLWGENCSDFTQAVKNADAAHIAVFGAGSDDCSDRYNSGGPGPALYAGHVIFNPAAPTIGQLYEQIGEEQAAAAIDVSEGKAQIIRPSTSAISFAQWENAGEDAVLKKCAGCKVLANVSWSPGGQVPNGPLYQQFATELSKYPTANVSLLTFDSMADSTGLSKAIVVAGRNRNMYTVAAEGYAAGMALIRQGNAGLQAEPSYSANWIAWATIDELNRYFNHKPLVPEGIGVRFVDATHNMPPAGQDYNSPINYEQDYKKAWGLGG